MEAAYCIQPGTREICYIAPKLEDLPKPGEQCPKCKTYFVWKVQGYGCPRCQKLPAKGKRSIVPAIKYGDGVYVDVSGINRTMTLGLVRIKDKRIINIQVIKRPDLKRRSDKAEYTAILIAREMFPEDTVYCDHEYACSLTGATYIDRSFNQLAHKAARGHYAPTTNPH